MLGRARSGPIARCGEPAAAAERRGKNINGFKDFYLKPRPESGLDCLACAASAIVHGVFVQGQSPDVVPSQPRNPKPETAIFQGQLPDVISLTNATRLFFSHGNSARLQRRKHPVLDLI